MMSGQPLFVVLAGPNGSRKSTAAAVLLESKISFVNADDITRALAGYPSRSIDLEAGRIPLERLDRLAEEQADFAFETTLASRSLAPRISHLKAMGYVFRLLFLFAPNPDFSVFRVASRVRSGGHHVPEETIRRRYRAGLANFRDLYRPLADHWIVYDNTGEGEPRIVASGCGTNPASVTDAGLWAKFEGRLAADE